MSIFEKFIKALEREEKGAETCDGCKHIYYDSGGGVACDSPYEHVCLKNHYRAWKEPIAE